MLTTTPTRSRCSGVIAAKSMPDAPIASLPAPIARWMNRLIRRAILRSMTVSGSKSSTSAAIWTSNADASNERTVRVPVTASRRLRQ